MISSGSVPVGFNATAKPYSENRPLLGPYTKILSSAAENHQFLSVSWVPYWLFYRLLLLSFIFGYRFDSTQDQ